LLFACNTADIVTVVTVLSPLPFDFVGTAPGATYIPLFEIYPVAWLPPVTPFTFHVTALLELPLTVAVNACVPNAATVGAAGAITMLPV
jgi:hypothetical protein